MRKLLIVLLVLCSALGWATACPTGYTNAKALIIHPELAGASDQTNFPVLFAFNGAGRFNSITLADLKVTGSGGKIQSSGNDIVFCDALSGGNLMSFERANYSTTTGKLEAYVKIPTLSHTSNNYVFMFYGKAADSDHSDAAGTWSNGFVEVWHLGNGSTLNVNGSLGSTGTNHGATAATGQVYGGSTVSSGSSQYIDTGKAQPALTNFTLSAWIVKNDTQTSFAVSSANATSASGIFILFENNAAFRLECGFRNAGSFTRRIGIATTGVLQKIDCVHTGGSADIATYSNGVSVAGSLHDTGASNPSATDNFYIGRDGAANTGYWNDQIDEVRVSNVVRSADWIAAEYWNLTSPGFIFMEDAPTAAPSGMSSGAYCVPVTVDHTQVSTNDQTNYQFHFHGYYRFMADTANGGFAVVGNGGKDIRWFSDSTCLTGLTFERVYWSSTTGDSEFKVLLPTLSHTVDKTIYMSIGKTSFTSDLSNPTGVWATYASAFHFGSPTSFVSTDSGPAALDVSNSVVGSGCTVGASPLGGAAYVTNDTVSSCGWIPALVPGTDNLGAHGYPVGSAAGSLTVWTQPTPLTAAETAANSTNVFGYGKANTTGQRGIGFYRLTDKLTGMPTVSLDVTSNPYIQASPGCGSNKTIDLDTDLQPHRIDFTYDSGVQIQFSNLYIDGVLISPACYAQPTTVLNTANGTGGSGFPSELRLGRDAAHGISPWTGYQSGLRITSGVLTADRIATEYANENTPWNFYSFGTAGPIGSLSKKRMSQVY